MGFSTTEICSFLNENRSRGYKLLKKLNLSSHKPIGSVVNKEDVDKITSLQSLIDDAEERIAKIKDSRDGILNTEVRLQKLYSDADSKLKLLHDITAKEVGSKPSAVTGSNITPQLKSNVIKLKKDGWKNAEIAKRLKIEENIVNLILEMGTDE